MGHSFDLLSTVTIFLLNDHAQLNQSSNCGKDWDSGGAMQ
jgi:hypothetical protein